MDDFHEQHIYVKFCSKLGKTFSETFEMLKQAFGDEVMSHTQTHLWYKRFKEDRNSIEDNDLRDEPQHQNMNNTFKKFGK